MFVEPYIRGISRRIFPVVLRPLKLYHNLKSLRLSFIFSRSRHVRNIVFVDALNAFIVRTHYFVRNSVILMYVLFTTCILHFPNLLICLSKNQIIGCLICCKVSTTSVVDYFKYVWRQCSWIWRKLRHLCVTWVVFLLISAWCVSVKYVICLKSLLQNYTTLRNGCTDPPRSVGGETSRIHSLLVSFGLVLSELTLFVGKWHLMFNALLWNSFKFNMSRFVTVVMNFAFIFCLFNNMCLGCQMFAWRDNVPPSFCSSLPMVTLEVCSVNES
jgi:hypothetical protein